MKRPVDGDEQAETRRSGFHLKMKRIKVIMRAVVRLTRPSIDHGVNLFGKGEGRKLVLERPVRNSTTAYGQAQQLDVRRTCR